MGPSAALGLLDDATASPASPRLASGPMALATRPPGLLPRAARIPFASHFPRLESSGSGSCTQASRFWAHRRQALFAGIVQPLAPRTSSRVLHHRESRNGAAGRPTAGVSRSVELAWIIHEPRGILRRSTVISGRTRSSILDIPKVCLRHSSLRAARSKGRFPQSARAVTSNPG